VDKFLAGECIGILEGLSVMAYDAVFDTSRACVPDNVTLGQMAAIVVSWFDRHPEDWHRNFKATALFAMHDAWPCKYPRMPSTGCPQPSQSHE
jgi:hypothetical protein